MALKTEEPETKWRLNQQYRREAAVRRKIDFRKAAQGDSPTAAIDGFTYRQRVRCVWPVAFDRV
jgi:hypothetical protein